VGQTDAKPPGGKAGGPSQAGSGASRTEPSARPSPTARTTPAASQRPPRPGVPRPSPTVPRPGGEATPRPASSGSATQPQGARATPSVRPSRPSDIVKKALSPAAASGRPPAPSQTGKAPSAASGATTSGLSRSAAAASGRPQADSTAKRLDESKRGAPGAAGAQPTDGDSAAALSGSDSAEARAELQSASDEDALDIPLTEDAELTEDEAQSDVIVFRPSDGPKLAPPKLAITSPLYTPRRYTVWHLLLVAVTVAVLAGGGLFVLTRKAVTGKLVVSVFDLAGAQVKSAKIALDGQKRCTSSPCVVEQIAGGAHVVRVLAAGHSQPTEQKVQVEPGVRTHLAVRLVRAPSAPVIAEVKTAPPEPKPAVSVAAQAAEEEPPEARDDKSADAGDKQPDAKAKAKKEPPPPKDGKDAKGEQQSKEAPAPKQTGELIVLCQPSGMVYVDGRPRGPSPRHIRDLPAGAHTVTVEPKEASPQTVKVNILAGKTVSVMLNP
jgi:hypothetical protein